MKVACFSVAALDYFPQQDRFFAGGNSLNQTLRFRELGHESAFLGALGQDEAGDQIFQLLSNSQVDTSHTHRKAGSTAANQIVNDEFGEREGVEGAWNGGVYENFRLTQADWDYISDFPIWATHANGINYDEALTRKGKNNFLAVDFLHFKTYELLEKGLQTVDIAYFGGTSEMLENLLNLSLSFKGVLVLTLGAEGSVAVEKGTTYQQKALPLEKVVDTTGCGDAFQAGFTANYYQTKDIEGSLLAGARLGREAASHYGGSSWRS